MVASIQLFWKFYKCICLLYVLDCICDKYNLFFRLHPTILFFVHYCIALFIYFSVFIIFVLDKNGRTLAFGIHLTSYLESDNTVVKF